MTNGPDPIKVRARAKQLIAFYQNLFWFVLINILVYFLDYRDNGVINYAYWVTFGWGIGVASHAFTIFFSTGLEDRITQDLIKKGKM